MNSLASLARKLYILLIKLVIFSKKIVKLMINYIIINKLRFKHKYCSENINYSKCVAFKLQLYEH